MRSIAKPSPSLKSSESMKLYTRCSAAERGAGDNLLQPRRQPDVFSHVQAPTSIALHGHHLLISRALSALPRRFPAMSA